MQCTLAMEPGSRPECPFGNSCYRKNPFHFQEYSHAHLAALLHSCPALELTEASPRHKDIGLDTLRQQLGVYRDIEKLLQTGNNGNSAAVAQVHLQWPEASQSKQPNTQEDMFASDEDDENIRMSQADHVLVRRSPGHQEQAVQEQAD